MEQHQISFENPEVGFTEDSVEATGSGEADEEEEDAEELEWEDDAEDEEGEEMTDDERKLMLELESMKKQFAELQLQMSTATDPKEMQRIYKGK